jgi:hypothetical protein
VPDLSLLRAHSHGGLGDEGEGPSALDRKGFLPRSGSWKGWVLVLLAAAAVTVYVGIHWPVLAASVSGLLAAVG